MNLFALTVNIILCSLYVTFNLFPCFYAFDASSSMQLWDKALISNIYCVISFSISLFLYWRCLSQALYLPHIINYKKYEEYVDGTEIFVTIVATYNGTVGYKAVQQVDGCAVMGGSQAL